ncbi:MAG: hypothetical protein AAF628_10250 [Planctomycetota bacterium]
MKISYDFDGSQHASVTLKVTYTPPQNEPEYCTVSPAMNCCTVTIPPSASQILVEDETGDSADASAPVLPPAERQMSAAQE